MYDEVLFVAGPRLVQHIPVLNEQAKHKMSIAALPDDSNVMQSQLTNSHVSNKLPTNKILLVPVRTII